MLHQRQLLVDDGDAFAFGIADVCRLDNFTGKDDFAFVAAVWVDPAQHFHQRRLARAVLAAQRNHFAGVQPEANVVDGFHRAEALGDAFHFK